MPGAVLLCYMEVKCRPVLSQEAEKPRQRGPEREAFPSHLSPLSSSCSSFSPLSPFLLSPTPSSPATLSPPPLPTLFLPLPPSSIPSPPTLLSTSLSSPLSSISFLSSVPPFLPYPPPLHFPTPISLSSPPSLPFPLLPPLSSPFLPSLPLCLLCWDPTLTHLVLPVSREIPCPLHHTRPRGPAHLFGQSRSPTGTWIVRRHPPVGCVPGAFEGQDSPLHPSLAWVTGTECF